MGATFSIFSEDVANYSPEKLIQDIALVASRIQAKFYLSEHKDHGIGMSLNWEAISSSIQKTYSKEEQYILLSVYSTYEIEKWQGRWDDIAMGKRLHCIAHADDFDGTLILYEFANEYIQIYPNQFFWLEDPWVYDWNAMQKIQQAGYTEDWCFKKPE